VILAILFGVYLAGSLLYMAMTQRAHHDQVTGILEWAQRDRQQLQDRLLLLSDPERYLTFDAIQKNGADKDPRLAVAYQEQEEMKTPDELAAEAAREGAVEFDAEYKGEHDGADHGL
jgi:hypothetical protein